MSVKIKDYYKMILGFIAFFLSGEVFSIVYNIVKNKPLDLSNDVFYAKVDLIVSAIIMFILVILYRKLLFGDLKRIKSQYKGYIKFFLSVLAAFGIFFAIKIGCSILETVIRTITKTPIQEVSNQLTVTDLLMAAPVYMIISACLVAPISEEVLYRGGIRQIIKNKKVFVPVSGLIFGLMHVTSCLTLLIEILMLGVVLDLILRSNMKKIWKVIVSLFALSTILLIYVGIYTYIYGDIFAIMKSLDRVELIGSVSYVIMGATFAYFYAKNDNIWYSILLHCINNALSILLILSF